MTNANLAAPHESLNTTKSLLFWTLLISTIVGSSSLWIVTSYIDFNERSKLHEELDQKVFQLMVKTIESGSMGAAVLLGLMDESIKQISLGQLPVDDPKVLKQLGVIKKRFSASSVFVMDMTGTIIAYSKGKKSSTGINASFRPYFQQAKKGIANLYPAIGSNSGKRGFYFAAPIYRGDEIKGDIIGIVVIKLGLNRVDRLLKSLKTPVLLVSPQGMVFASTPNSWRNKMLGDVTHERWQAVREAKQFGRQFEVHPPQGLALDVKQRSMIFQQKSYAIASQTYSWKDPGGDWTMVLLKENENWFPVSWKLAILVIETLIVFLILMVISIGRKQKKERQAHQQQTLPLSTAIEQSPVSIYMTDANGCIQYTNPHFRQMTGYTEEELLGASPDILAPDVAHYGAHKVLMNAIKKGNAWQGELYNQTKTGEHFWESTSIAPVNDAEGEIIQYIAICENISQQKQTEKHLAQAKEAAEHANRMKSEFLANMSHEIRTPMNGLTGMLSLLEKTSMTDTQAEYIQHASNSSDTLLKLINNILDLSRVEAGKLELEHILFEPQLLLEQIVSLHAPLAEDDGLILNCHLEPSISPMVYGDPARLGQIITNLLNNAIKFTQEGHISISMSFRNTTENDTEMLCEVIDTGIGISDDMHQPIFELFSQADSSNTRRYGGTGLGLNIVRHLVHLMKGDIWVDSGIDKGSRFTFKVKLNTMPPPIQPKNEPLALPIEVMTYSNNQAQTQEIQRWVTYWKQGMHVLEEHDNPLTKAQLLRQKIETPILILLDSDQVARLPQLETQVREQTLTDSYLIILEAANKPLKNQVSDRIFYLARPIMASRLQKIYHQIDTATANIQAVTSTIQSKQYRAHALIVEDNPINQHTLNQQLKMHGLTTIQAVNGKEALALLKQDRFDLVFMDCQMPEMDGFDTVIAFRAFENETQKQHTPIIALTAKAMRGDKEKCIASGMDDYLSKPLAYDDLLHALDQWTV